MNTSTCMSCGTALTPEATFCPRCGQARQGPPPGTRVLGATRPCQMARPYRAADMPEPTLAGGRADVPLGEAFNEYDVGGGGWFHVFYLFDARKISVVDVGAGGTIRQIPTGPDPVRFATGL